MGKFGLAVLAVFYLGGTALADPIEGTWKTKSGAEAAIAPCGQAFCITLKSGKHTGRRIGRLEPAGSGAYAGEITDPNKDRTYSGKASLSGDRLKLSGCVLGGLICRGEDWSRR